MKKHLLANTDTNTFYFADPHRLGLVAQLGAR
jgi:hypothetical protein